LEKGGTLMNSKYLDSIHRLGKIGSTFALLAMLGIPTVIAIVYNIMPDFGEIFKISSGLLIVFVPVAVSECISYMPVLGSASYITYITGNVLNLKLPVAINASNVANTKQGKEENDVIVTLAVAISSMVTMAILAVSILLIAPLSPIFSLPTVQTATDYILPALFGGMFLPMLLDNTAGEYRVKNKLIPLLIPFILIILFNTFIVSISGFEGPALLVTIPLTIILARYFYNKCLIKMTAKE